MAADTPNDPTEDERVYFAALDAAAVLADRCLQYRGRDLGNDPLSQIINYPMTEFWDRSFSQSEIRRAFTAL